LDIYILKYYYDGPMKVKYSRRLDSLTANISDFLEDA